MQEEVEVEAKVAGVKGRLASVLIQASKKDNGDWRTGCTGKTMDAEAALIPKVTKDKIQVSRSSNSKL